MKQKSKNLSPDAKIGFGEHLAYGIGGGFATNAVNLFIATFIIVFYTEVMHVNPLLVSTVIGISKLLDGLSDLVAGRVIDKTHSKLGKTHIWMLRMIPVTIIAIFAVFLMPYDMPEYAQVIYIFITYNLASTVCYTLTYVAFMTLNGLMTRDQKSRGLNGGINMVGNVLATLAGNATIISALKAFSNDPAYSAYGDRAGWLKLLAIWMVVLAIAQLIVVFGTHERVVDHDVEEEAEKKAEKKSQIPISVTMKALFANKYWVINIIIGLTISFLMGCGGSTSSFYMTYVVGDTAFYQSTSTANTVCMLIALLLSFGIMAKFGKRNTIVLGLAVRFAGSFLPALSSAKAVLLAGSVLSGLGYGAAGCAFASLVQDTLTYGEWKNGFGMIGMGNAANSFCNKVGNSLGTVFLGWIMSFSGYIPGVATQSDSAVLGIKFMYIWMPVIFTFVALIAAWFYDLDKIYPKIVSDLKEGKYAPGVMAYKEDNEARYE